MNWYEFDTRELFDTWHAKLNAKLGYPNTETGTLEYTQAYEIEGKWISYIDDIYAEGLTLTDLRLPRKSVE